MRSWVAANVSGSTPGAYLDGFFDGVFGVCWPFEKTDAITTDTTEIQRNIPLPRIVPPSVRTAACQFMKRICRSNVAVNSSLQARVRSRFKTAFRTNRRHNRKLVVVRDKIALAVRRDEPA